MGKSFIIIRWKIKTKQSKKKKKTKKNPISVNKQCLLDTPAK